MSRLLRGLAFGLVLLGSAAIAPQSSQRSSGSIGELPSSRLAPEVRLRKLHLVRPDLIPYPVSYEVYC